MAVPKDVVIHDSGKIETSQRRICEIAADIILVWSEIGKGVNYAAKPYLEAMLSLDTIEDIYGLDTAESVILYGLSNMSTFRGPKAKELKAELKAHLPKK
jgi:hypothetical protein